MVTMAHSRSDNNNTRQELRPRLHSASHNRQHFSSLRDEIVGDREWDVSRTRAPDQARQSNVDQSPQWHDR
jgi:hypothetical protein